MEITGKEIKKEKLCIMCLNKGSHTHIYLKTTPEYLKKLLDFSKFRINEKFYLCENCEKGDYATRIKWSKK